MRAVHRAVRAFSTCTDNFFLPLVLFSAPHHYVRNVRYEPYGPWDHFPSGFYGQPPATRRRGSDSDSDSSSSGSSLTSADEEEEEASS